MSTSLTVSGTAPAVGDIVNLTVDVAGARDVFAATVDINLDDEKLLPHLKDAIAEAQPGDWFTDGLDAGQYAVFTYVKPEGLRVVLTLLGDAAPRNGAGTLVTIPLQAVTTGEKLLELGASVQVEFATRGEFGAPATRIGWTVAGEPQAVAVRSLQAPVLVMPATGRFNAPQPVLEGTGEPGWTMYLADLIPGQALSTEVGPDGRWQVKPSSDLADGEYSVTLSQEHPVTHVRSVEGQYVVIVDTTPPVLTVGVAPDHIRQGDVRVTLTASELLAPATVAGAYRAPGGAQPVALSFWGPGANGEYTATFTVDPTGLESKDALVATVTASAKDMAGNAGAPVEKQFRIDTLAVLTQAWHTATGALGAGKSFRVAAQGEPGATVTADLGSLRQGPLSLVEQTVDSSRSLYLSPTITVAPGQNFDAFVPVKMVDKVGNQTVLPTATRLVVDTTPPAPVLVAPGVTSPWLPAAPGGLTLQVNPGADGSSLLLNGQLTVLGQQVRFPFTYNPATQFYEAKLTSTTFGSLQFVPSEVSLVAVDQAGNAATVPTGFLVGVDTVAPNIQVKISGGTMGKAGWLVQQPKVEVLPDSDVAEIRYILTEAGTAKPEAVYSGEFTPAGSATGEYRVEAWAIDHAGNAGPHRTLSYKYDGQAPAQPVLTVTKRDDSSVAGGGLVNDRQVKVAVQTEPGAVVMVSTRGGNSVTAQASAAGLAQATLALPEGPVTVSAKAFDAAGNGSPESSPVTFTVDTTRPQFNIALSGQTLTVTASEALKTIPAVTVNGEVAVVTEAAAKTYTVAVTEAGNTKIQVTGTDLAGNEGKGVKVVQVVVQAQAAEIASDDNSVSLSVPAGALPEGGSIEVNAGVATTGSGTGMEAALQVALNYKTASQQERTFNQPVTATFRVPVPAGVDPVQFKDSIKLMLWRNNAWVDVGSTDATIRNPRLLTDNNTVVQLTVEFHHFSDWQFAGDLTPPALALTAPVNGTEVGPMSPTNTLATGLRITGTTEAGATVTVFLGAQNVATGAVANNGSFTADVPWAQLPEGATATLTVEAKDAANNKTTQTVTVTKDSVVTNGLTVNALPARTNATSVAVSGTTEAGATVTADNGAVKVSTTAGADGSFSLTVPLRNTAGQETANTLAFEAKDALGNVAQVTQHLTQDAKAPGITAALAAVVNADPATFTVTTDESATVVVTGAGVTVTPAQSTGTNHTFTLDFASNPGAYALTITATDAASNFATISRAVTYNPDTPSLSVSALQLTRSRNVVATGNTVAGGSLEASVDSETDYAPAGLADAGGAFTIPVTLPDADGEHTVYVRVTNVDTGAVNTYSLTVTLDRVAPAITITAPANNASVANATTQVDLQATVNEAATWQVKLGSTVVYTSAAKELAVSKTVANLAVGANVITVIATDAAGNEATATVTVTRQSASVPGGGGGGGGALPPVAPTVSISGPADQAFVKTPTLAVTGQASPAGTTVSLTVNGADAGSATVDAQGAFSLSASMTEGANTLVVTAKNGTLTATASVTVTLDTKAPALQVTAPAETADARIAIVVTTEPGAKVSIGGKALGTANAAGRLESQIALKLGANTFVIQAVDAAGNQSEAKLVTITRKSPAVQPPTPNQEPATGHYAPGTGALITNDTLTVTVPPFAFTRPADLRIAVADLDGVPVTGYRLITAADVTAQGEGTAQRGTITLRFRFDPAQLGDANPLALRVFYWHEILKAWIPLPTSVDLEGRTVSADVDHLTTFALMAPADKAPAFRNLPAFSFEPALTVQGTAAPGAAVAIYNDGVPAAVATANNLGDFSAAVTLSQGANTLVAVVKSGGTVSATAEARVLHATAAQLSDMDSHWARSSVYRMIAQGVTTGFEDRTFRPEAQVTRAQFVTFLLRALGYEPDANPQLAFADRGEIQPWAQGWLSRGVALGLIKGFEDNTIRPEAPITRAEMAVLIDRALAMKPVRTEGTGKTFADAASIPAWAEGAVAKAARLGLITGYADGTFGPEQFATRAEALVIIQRFLDLR